MRFSINNLTSLQRNNLNSALEAYDTGNIRSSFSPAILYLELTRNCMSHCTYCRRWWTNKPEYTMSDELFEILLREYIPYASLVDLRGWGESLILPNFDEYVTKVAALSPHLRLTTTLACGSRKALESLVDNNVFVSVSFDCANKLLYEKIRKGLSYDTVINNIKFLTEQMKKRGTLEDAIRIGIAPLQAITLDHLEGVIIFASRYGISEVVIDGLSARPYHLGLLCYHKKHTIKVLKKAVTVAKKEGVRLRMGTVLFKELMINKHVFDFCCHPWLYLFINYKGQAIACDHLMWPTYSCRFFGQLHEGKENLWNGINAKDFRTAHLTKKRVDLPSMCRRCYKEGRYSDHEHDVDIRFQKWLVTEKELAQQLESL